MNYMGSDMTTDPRHLNPDPCEQNLLVRSYKDHVGSVELSDLSQYKQDEFIRLLFEPSEFREWVIQNDVKHELTFGLACLVGVIIRIATGDDYYDIDYINQPLNDKQRLRALDLLSGTMLGSRLKAAFCHGTGQINYDWQEMYKIAEIDIVMDEDFPEIKNYLQKISEVSEVGSVEYSYDSRKEFPDHSENGNVELSYDKYKEGWDNGTLTLYVDRGLATQVFRHSKPTWAHWLPLVFLGGLLAFIPVMIFVNFIWGLAVLILAIVSRKMLSAKAVDWVRQDSLGSPDRYQWYSSRKIVWTEKIKSTP